MNKKNLTEKIIIGLGSLLTGTVNIVPGCGENAYSVAITNDGLELCSALGYGGYRQYGYSNFDCGVMSDDPGFRWEY